MAQQKLINKPGNSITRKLAADVTDAPRAVAPTANDGEVAVTDSQNALAEGVILENGSAGDLVPVFVDGIVPMKAGAAINSNVDMLLSATGTVYPCPYTSGTIYNSLGKSRTKCTAANEYVSVQILPQKISIKS